MVGAAGATRLDGPTAAPRVTRVKPRDLAGRVVVVTGASSGIGAATAVACGRAGMRVVLAARRAERLAAVAADVIAAGGDARVVPTDVADEAAVQALVEGTVTAWGRLDVLVNNAGVGILATVDQTTPAEFERLVRVNYLGAVHGVLAALPHMRRQGAGHIVNVASVVGKRASPFRAAYVGSKFALVGLLGGASHGAPGVGDRRDVRLSDRHRDGVPRRRDEPPGRARAGRADPERRARRPGDRAGAPAPPRRGPPVSRRRGSSSSRTSSPPVSSTAC